MPRTEVRLHITLARLVSQIAPDLTAKEVEDIARTCHQQTTSINILAWIETYLEINHARYVSQIAPDLTAKEVEDIARLALRQGVDGLVISNTTTARPPLVASHQHGAEVPALDRPGPPLHCDSRALLHQSVRLVK